MQAKAGEELGLEPAPVTSSSALPRDAGCRTTNSSPHAAILDPRSYPCPPILASEPLFDSVQGLNGFGGLDCLAVAATEDAVWNGRPRTERSAGRDESSPSHATCAGAQTLGDMPTTSPAGERNRRLFNRGSARSRRSFQCGAHPVLLLLPNPVCPPHPRDSARGLRFGKNAIHARNIHEFHRTGPGMSRDSP